MPRPREVGFVHVLRTRRNKLVRGWLWLPDGSKRWVSGRTDAEVRRAGARALEEAEAAAPPEDAALTVSGYVREWIATRATLGKIRPGTAALYLGILRRHVDPAFGSTPLLELEPTAIERLYARMLGSGLAPRTVHKVHILLRAAFATAEDRFRRKWAGRGPVWWNPATLVDPPPAASPERRPVGLAEVAAVLRAAGGDRLEIVYHLGIETGLRSGEIFELEDRDVDLGAGLLRVREKARRVAGLGIVRDAPKSAAGRRAFSLPATCVAAIRRRLEVRERERPGYAPRWRGTRRLVGNAAGGYLEPQNFLTREWYPLLVRAGLAVRHEPEPPRKSPRYTRPDGTDAPTFHEFCRHGHASLLAWLRIDRETMRRRMGHRDAGTTDRWYVHPVSGADEEAARALDRLFRGLLDGISLPECRPGDGSGGR